MNRRTLLAAVAGAIVSGCVTAAPDGEPAADDGTESETTDDENTSSDDPERDQTVPEPDLSSDDAVLQQFESILADGGFEGIVLGFVDDGIDLEYDATGPTEDDVATEIELITDGYTTLIEEDVSVTRLEAVAYDPADEPLDRFEIDTEWVAAYLDGSIEWRELLTAVAATFASLESADTDGDSEDDPTEDESGDTEDGNGDDTEESDDAGGDGDS